MKQATYSYWAFYVEREWGESLINAEYKNKESTAKYTANPLFIGAWDENRTRTALSAEGFSVTFSNLAIIF